MRPWRYRHLRWVEYRCSLPGCRRLATGTRALAQSPWGGGGLVGYDVVRIGRDFNRDERCCAGDVLDLQRGPRGTEPGERELAARISHGERTRAALNRALY